MLRRPLVIRHGMRKYVELYLEIDLLENMYSPISPT